MQSDGTYSVDKAQLTMEILIVCERLSHNLQVFIYDNKLVTGEKILQESQSKRIVFKKVTSRRKRTIKYKTVRRWKNNTCCLR